jgi:hypothetical protein
MDGLTHLGCCEETDDERAERRKVEKKAREAKRRKAVLSQEARAPWRDLGISRRTWFRLRQAERSRFDLELEMKSNVVRASPAWGGNQGLSGVLQTAFCADAPQPINSLD